METLGRRLRWAREGAGLSQAEAAAHLGVSHTLLSRWENDRRVPQVPELKRLAELYHVSADFLLGVGTEKKEPEEAPGDSPAAQPYPDAEAQAGRRTPFREDLPPRDGWMRIAENLTAVLRQQVENERLRIVRVEAVDAEARREAQTSIRLALELSRQAGQTAPGSTGEALPPRELAGGEELG